jgi:hypothetical protein
VAPACEHSIKGNIRKQRKKPGPSHEEAPDLCGLNWTCIGGFECGEPNASLVNTAKNATALMPSLSDRLRGV